MSYTPTREELIRWGEAQQTGLNTPAKYRFVEYHLEEVKKDYEKFLKTRNVYRRGYP